MARRVDEYLRLAAPSAKTITEAIQMVADSMGVALSTVHRWRRNDEVTKAKDCLELLSLISLSQKSIHANDPTKARRVGLNDMAILCNVKKR